MWTPRRLLLLVTGCILFGSGYAVYGYCLGRIDGLPPLPERYLPENQRAEAPGSYAPPTVSYVDARLEQAFGKDCVEVKKRAIKMEVGARHLYMAADDFTILKDGRAQFKPFSVAIFGKPRPDGGYPEINTIQCDEAVIEFDKPLTNSAEQVGDRRITGGTLQGRITIINNRRTPQRNDDISLYTPHGPVYYEESQHHIWIPETEVVELKDMQSQPEPMTITAAGLDIWLLAEDRHVSAPPPPAHGHPRKKAENIGGVERVHLRADVTMTLFVDSRSGFLGASTETAGRPGEAKVDPPSPATPPSIPPKAKVIITTQGPFDYDMVHDQARFSISRLPFLRSPDVVEVTRIPNLKRSDLTDQLECDQLELQFHRKGQGASPPAGDSPPGAAGQSVELEIESAHATGKQVILTSGAENLNAEGNELFYDARKHETILKGEGEMVAMKEGSDIHARELRILGGDRKETQEATAIGPGHLSVLDSKTGTRPLEAHWDDKLVWSKDGPNDLLVLTGNASFLQRQTPPPPAGDRKDPPPPPDFNAAPVKPLPIEQELEADRLKVWLKQSASPAAGSGGERRTPTRLEATGHVRANSADMRVHDTDSMLVLFRDVEPLVGPPLPAQEQARRTAADGGPLPPKTTATPPTPAASPGPAPQSARPGSASAPTAAGAAGPTPVQPEKTKKPIDLSARYVEAHVLRFGTRNDLERLRSEGTVHVTQEPSGPDDKGVDIRGQTLQLEHEPGDGSQSDGNKMVVTADREKGPNELAYVQIDKITMLGPVVTIDQVRNTVDIKGVGSMKMPSSTNFEGEKLRETKDLTVHWKQSMFFDGKSAVFEGNVQADMDLPEAEKRKLPPSAETEISHLACQMLQVFLDRAVPLRPGARDPKTPAAKVDHLVCDKQVWIENARHRLGKLQEYKRIVSTQLELDNLESDVRASGPGIVYILQLGAKGEDLPMAPSPDRPPPARTVSAPPVEEELKLTRVSFDGYMLANNVHRTAVFTGNVEVIHLASDNPDVPVDITKPLPKGAMYMRSEHLKVSSHKHADGKTSHQELEANNHVLVQSQEFWGRGDRVTYDESKELVIFEGLNGNLATLYRENGRGGQRGEVKGKKIFYWRRTNDFKTEDSTNWRSQ